MESRVRGAWATGDPGRTGQVRDRARVPGRPGSAARAGPAAGPPPGRGLTADGGGNRIQPSGSRVEPRPRQLCKREEEVPRLPRGEGQEGWSAAAAPAPAVRVAPVSSAPDAETCCNKQATAGAPSSQRRSGWAGGREGKAGGRRGELVGRPGVAA